MQGIVVGGGVFGVAAAWELRRRGYDVVLMERSAQCPGDGGASNDINRIVRADYGADEFYTKLGAKSLPIWREWNARSVTETGKAIFTETGVLFSRQSPMVAGTYEGDSIAATRAAGLRVNVLTTAERTQKYPAWNGGNIASHHTYFNADAGMAHASRAVAWMATQAKREGVRFLNGLRGHVLSIERVNGVAHVRTADGALHHADAIVVAAGPWSPALLPELRDKVTAVGQPLIYVRIPPTLVAKYSRDHFPVFTADISTSGIYGFSLERTNDNLPVIKIGLHGRGYVNEQPTFDGGVCSQPVQRSAPASDCETLIKFVRSALPDLRHAEVHESRLCWYDDSWNGDYYITRVGDVKNLFVAAGSSGHGFKFAPVLGEIIADVVQGKQSAEITSRFGWRAPGAKAIEACRSDNSLPISLADIDSAAQTSRL